MAGYICPHCGESSDPFGSGGAEAAAKELGVPFLGRLPLSAAFACIGRGHSARRRRRPGGRAFADSRKMLKALEKVAAEAL